MKPNLFPARRTAYVPVIYGTGAAAALAAARLLANEVVLVGLVSIPADQSVSAGTLQAREVRRQLRELAPGHDTTIRSRAVVHVSHAPWQEMLDELRAGDTDLLVLEWESHLTALGVTAADVLNQAPCDVVLMRGPFPNPIRRALVPLRGGPHAELALRLGLALQPDHLTALHLTPPGDFSDAPYRGLEQVLRRLPEVLTISAETTDRAQAILSHAADCDIVVLGATQQPLNSVESLGPVADRVLHEAPSAVMVVRNRRLAAGLVPDAASGTQAISILVDKWFAENTFDAAEFDDIDHLVALKQAQGLTVSLALPALNEGETVGQVIRCIQEALMERAPLIDEIVLIDSNSTDQTREIAAALGVPVFIHQQVLPEWGARPGKGEALWKSLHVTRGDIIAWIDTDIVNIHPRFVYGILGPLLLNPSIKFSKGFYRRPLRVGGKIQAGGGGRVTELTARPLLNLFFPELSGVVQPLSGEYAGRRDALEQLSFFSGYGVETGLLIDVFESFGLSAIAQVNLLERIHHNQPLEALSKMSFAILQAVIRKLEGRYGQTILEDVNKSMKLIRYQSGSYFLDVEEIVEHERPPMVHIPEYAARRAELAQ